MFGLSSAPTLCAKSAARASMVRASISSDQRQPLFHYAVDQILTDNFSTVTNTGCLGESGRNSILFHNSGGDNGEGYALNWFSDSECIDNVQCASGFVFDSGCINLSGNPGASSFTFEPGC